MAVTIESITQVGKQSFKLVYSSDLGGTPTFYIYLDGILVALTIRTNHIISISPDEQVMIEILDTTDAPSQVFPGKIRLCWFAVDSANYYHVDEYIDSVWTERARIDDNSGYMNFDSRFVEDGQNHRFRIVAVDSSGNESTAAELIVLCVRHPDGPDVDYSYDDGTGKVTIS